MRRKTTLAGLVLLGLLVARPAPAFVLSLGIGEGVLINPSTGDAYRRTAAAAPLSFELVAGLHVTPYMTVDVGFLWAYDVVDDPYWDDATVPELAHRSKSYYLGFRPGIHLYGGAPDAGVRPYFRAALPFQYDDANRGRWYYGVLLGGGLDFKLGPISLFGEITVAPFFNHENLIPIEGRLGIAVGFGGGAR